MTRLISTPYDALTIGQEAQVSRLCRAEDFLVFAHCSGNLNPMHLPAEDGDGDGLPEAVAPAAWVAALISGVVGNQLPGPGSLYLSQSLRFVGRAQAGDTLWVRVRVAQKLGERAVQLAASVEGPGGLVAEGEVVVRAPDARRQFDNIVVPALIVQSHLHFDALLARAEPLPALPTIVICPESPDAVLGAVRARDHSLIAPIFVGAPDKIAAAAAQAGSDIAGDRDRGRARSPRRRAASGRHDPRLARAGLDEGASAHRSDAACDLAKGWRGCAPTGV